MTVSAEFFEIGPETGLASPHITGTVRRFSFRAAGMIEPRNIDIWLPPSYAHAPERRYPVLYMHDGQNLFEPGHAFTNNEWEVDETLTRLIEAGQAREVVVVGVWNTARRFREYQPGQPFQSLPPTEAQLRAELDAAYLGGALGDEYLSFIVRELKPFVDRHFRTRPGLEDTAMMGSSMGGIISLYAVARYPDIFGRVACLSTHYPLILGDHPDIPPIFLRYLKTHLPRPGRHRLYFDFGTRTFDAWYEPYQEQMDAVLRELGYRSGVDWITCKFEGEEHSEVAWKKRLHIPLSFLLAPE